MTVFIKDLMKASDSPRKSLIFGVPKTVSFANPRKFFVFLDLVKIMNKIKNNSSRKVTAYFSFCLSIVFLAMRINLVNSIPTAPFFNIPKSLKASSCKKSDASLVTLPLIRTFSGSLFHSVSSSLISGVCSGIKYSISAAIVNIFYKAIYKFFPRATKQQSLYIRSSILLYNRTTGQRKKSLTSCYVVVK